MHTDFTTAFVPLGQVFLLGSLGFSFFSIVRGRTSYQEVLEKALIGFLALFFFASGLKILEDLSRALADAIHALGGTGNLTAVLLSSLKRAAAEPAPGFFGASVAGPSQFNLPAVLEQAWRTGVWGILSGIVDWFFLVSSFVIESAQRVLWILLQLLFPVGCGVFPIYPVILENLSLYAVELSLWVPMLNLVERATSLVANEALNRPGSLGLYLAAVELVAIILILSIPKLTHRFLSGGFIEDLALQSGVSGLAQKGIALLGGVGL